MINNHMSSIDAALKRLADKHWNSLKAKMTEQGMDPEKGWILVLPTAHEAKAPGHRPVWVHFSTSVDEPRGVNMRAAGQEK